MSHSEVMIGTFRRQILPPLFGVLVMLLVLLVINGQWLLAQLTYRFSAPSASAAIAAEAETYAPDPNAAPNISIPSIRTSAPVIFEPSYQESQVQQALRRGVVKFATTADPGQPGNVVIFGHSSGQPWAPGDYKFVFTSLDKLKTGDKIFIDYAGTRYIYRMTGSQVVLPTEVGVINPTDRPTLTLITCTPVGTSLKRLVVTAEQISPKPAATATAGAAAGSAPVAQPSRLPDGQ